MPPKRGIQVRFLTAGPHNLPTQERGIQSPSRHFVGLVHKNSSAVDVTLTIKSTYSSLDGAAAFS